MDTTKTTLNLPSDLLHDAKVHALENRLSLTQLITEALQLRLGRPPGAAKLSLSDFISQGAESAKKPTTSQLIEQYHRHLKETYGQDIS